MLDNLYRIVRSPDKGGSGGTGIKTGDEQQTIQAHESGSNDYIENNELKQTYYRLSGGCRCDNTGQQDF